MADPRGALRFGKRQQNLRRSIAPYGCRAYIKRLQHELRTAPLSRHFMEDSRSHLAPNQPRSIVSESRAIRKQSRYFLLADDSELIQ